MRPRSIRSRLTIWYVAVLALLLAAFSSAVYVTLREWLNETLTDSVNDRALATEALVEFGADGGPALDIPADETDPDFGETFQRLIGSDGGVIFDNSGTGAGDGSREAIEEALEGRETVATVSEGGRDMRVVTRPLFREGDVAGVLQVGESTEDVDEILRGLLIILALAGPATLVVASFGGWWLAGRALAPIDRITRAAAEISEQDLSRRLDLGLPDDEVGRLARTFDQMIGRLEHAFQRERRLTADASHELRTPLTAVRGQIDVALQRPRDAAEYQRVLAAVNEQIERMSRTVGGLLMLARSDAGALALEHEPVSVRDVVESVVEQVRPLAAEKGLEMRIEPSGEATVAGDEDLILQMMLNLADNAIKYTPRGSVTLGWRPSSGAVELFVADTGGGVPAEHRERIFERFHRVEQTRSGGGGGSGLGLAICKWIAEAHGGSIRLEDGATQGATFVVTIPAARAG